MDKNIPIIILVALIILSILIFFVKWRMFIKKQRKTEEANKRMQELNDAISNKSR